jgi:aryl-alcohol dehydrogenase-like predicted oxidoreductase
VDSAGPARPETRTSLTVRSYSAIAGAAATKLHRLEENIGAAAVQLRSDDLREIDNAASQVTVYGARYPEHLERMTGR